VFSVSAGRHTTVRSDHVTCVSYDACPFLGYISKSPGGFRQLRAVAAAEALKQERIGTRSTEEYKKSACEGLTCDLRTLCAL
jgi:hypothetical protein